MEPKLKNSSDEEVAIIREKLYGMAQLVFDTWKDTPGSKIPLGLRKMDDEK